MIAIRCSESLHSIRPMPKDTTKSPLKLCRCTECLKRTSFDKVGKEVRGQWVSKHTFTEHRRPGKWQAVDMMEIESAAMRATMGDNAPMSTNESVLFNSHQAEVRGGAMAMDDSDRREQAPRGESTFSTWCMVK